MNNNNNKELFSKIVYTDKSGKLMEGSTGSMTSDLDFVQCQDQAKKRLEASDCEVDTCKPVFAMLDCTYFVEH